MDLTSLSTSSQTIMITLAIILGLLMFVVYIITLIHQAKRRKWIWFVFTLIWGITLIIYWIVWIFNGRKWNRRKR